MSANNIAVLFARSDSNYKSIPGLDVYDIERDARTWQGGTIGIYHPPCRAWGKFSMFAKPRDDEKELAIWAVDRVRKYGGVIEHPKGSALWGHCGLPLPGQGTDEFGGWTLGVHQHWFGHRAQKATLLYIVGCSPDNIPEIPLILDYPTHVIGDVGRASDGTKRPEISKAEREHTPPAFAAFLIEIARRCNAGGIGIDVVSVGGML